MQNKLKQIIIILLFLSTITTQVYADTEIQFGNNKDQISIDKSSEGIWKPLFFDVDQNSNIHIPDFFKGRIAIFTPEGKLYKELQINEGISSRMNYFALNQDNTYTTYDNYSLYLLSQEGTVIWKVQMGLGAIPQHIYRDNRGIFIKFPSSVYYQYSYESGKLTNKIEDILLNNKTEEKNSILLYQDKNSDIWITNKNRQILVNEYYDKNNKEQKKLPIQRNSTNGSGFWIIRGLDKNIYSSLYSNRNLKIVQP